MREQHELSKAFPPMSEEEFQILKDSIENIGVQTPIVIFEDKVIDGWHRYTAAMEVGLPCPEVDLADDVDPRDFVLANNKARRHLTKSQLALSYSKVYQWNPSSKKSRGEPGSPHKTNQELAEMVGTSARTIQQAKTVLTKGDKAVVEAVETGKISVKRGSQIAKLPKEQQESAITAPPEPKPSILEGSEPSAEELMANDLAMQADLELVNQFLESDDKLAELYAEVKKLNHMLAQKESRIASLMREKSECIKLCHKLQKENDN
jgi:ParB-like chromosome segregation protein Spo0J